MILFENLLKYRNSFFLEATVRNMKACVFITITFCNIVFKALCLLICLCEMGCSIEKPIPANLSSRAFISIENDIIDIGTVPFESNYVKGKIKFGNVGSGDLKILNVSGPCTCFAGYSGDDHLAPGQSGELEVRFDKEYLEHGEQSKVISISTNDPENKIVKLLFNFTILGHYANNDIRIFPRTVDYGRCYQSSFNKELFIKLVLPNGEENYNLSGIEVVMDSKLLTVKSVEKGITTNNFNDELTYAYILTWKETPIGYFEEDIIFFVYGLQDGKQKKVTLNIRGDAIGEISDSHAL